MTATLTQGVGGARVGGSVLGPAWEWLLVAGETISTPAPPTHSSQTFLSIRADNRCVEEQPESVRVLVVDDEPSIVDVVSMALRHAGFGVESAGNGRAALEQVRRWHPHVMVLDVMLPDMEGFEVARRLSAEHAEVPILFLSARDAAADKVRGLTTGGDDYVTKPFSLEELIARLRNILRRTGALRQSSSRLRFSDLELDEDTFEVSRDGRSIELTATEFRLLRYLMLNPRRVLTRAQLLDHVWSYDFGGDARVLETYISYLRKKIDAQGPPLLHTVRGVGYALRLPKD
jgi:two-component system, OmpR family, response regulator